MKRSAKRLYFYLLRLVVQPVLRREKESPPFSVPNERAVEYAFVFRQLSRDYPARVLDVGTGTTALPHLIANCGFRVTAIDNVRDYWKQGLFNRHYLVDDVSVTSMPTVGEYDMVTCVSTLEQIDDYRAAVKSMAERLRRDGLLVMTFPYTEDLFVENVYDLDGSDAPKDNVFGAHSFSKSEVEDWETQFGLAKIDAEYWRFYEPGPWSVGEMVTPPLRSISSEKHQIACFAWRKI